MTDQLIKVDEKAVALRNAIEDRSDLETSSLTFTTPADSVLAPTLFIARRGGGTGASTLAAVLEYLTRAEALVIEIGGNPSPGFKSRPQDRYFHFSSNDPYRVNHALDLRLQHASKVAIVEFEPSLYRESLRVAASLRAMVSYANALMLFYIAGPAEHASPYKTKANEKGLMSVFMCRQPTQGVHTAQDGYLQLPWLDRSILTRIQSEGLPVADAIRKCTGLWTGQEARLNISLFAQAILKDEGQ